MAERDLATPVTQQDHALGLATAPVTLVEYGDFECPFCRAARPIVREILATSGDGLRLIFRHFPVASVHPHARRAAEAAEAAASQGRFWEMHDLLFEHQDALEDDNLVDYATRVGLDIDRFRKEMDAQQHRDRIQEDLLSGLHSGVRGTPTFFINGARHEGRWERDELLAAIAQHA